MAPRSPGGDFDALAGAGAIRSTVDDLLTFAKTQLDPASTELERSVRAAHEPTFDGEMGLGWHIQTNDEGRSVIWHNGGTGGYASFLGIDRATGAVVIILTASTEYDAVTRAGFEFFAEQDQEIVATSPSELEQYVGTYKIADEFFIRIFIEGSELISQATGQGRLPISATDKPDEFRPKSVDASIQFHRDGEVVNALTLFQSGQEMNAPRVSDSLGPQVYQEIDIPREKLADYVGDYSLNFMSAFEISERDGQLFAQLTAQPAFPVFPYAEDRFFYKVVDAQLEFLRDDSSAVIGLNLHQNGVHNAPRK